MPKKAGKGKKKMDESVWTPREDENGDNNNRSVFSTEESKKSGSRKTEKTPEPMIEEWGKQEFETPGEPIEEEHKHEEKESKPEQIPMTPQDDHVEEAQPEPVEEVKPEPVEEVIPEPVVEAQPIVEEKPIEEPVPEVQAPVVEETQPEPVEVKVDEQSSGFQVVTETKIEPKATPAPVQIESNHVTVQQPQSVGIKGIKRDIHPEINSPFRRKKTLGGLTLSVVQQEPSSPISETNEEEDEHRFDQLVPYWDQVLANLAISKQHFEDLKREPLERHCEMYRNGEYQTLVSRWSKTLELALPADSSIDNETLTLFNAKVKETLDEITNFIHILSDWVESKMHQLEDEQPAELLEKKEEHQEDDDHILEAERMGISSANPAELKGLVREASIRIEKGEPALVKKAPSKTPKQKEGDNSENKNSDPEDSMMPKLVIGAALVVAVGVMAFKFMKK